MAATYNLITLSKAPLKTSWIGVVILLQAAVVFPASITTMKDDGPMETTTPSSSPPEVNDINLVAKAFIKKFQNTILLEMGEVEVKTQLEFKPRVVGGKLSSALHSIAQHALTSTQTSSAVTRQESDLSTGVTKATTSPDRITNTDVVTRVEPLLEAQYDLQDHAMPCITRSPMHAYSFAGVNRTLSQVLSCGNPKDCGTTCDDGYRWGKIYEKIPLLKRDGSFTIPTLPIAISCGCIKPKP